MASDSSVTPSAFSKQRRCHSRQPQRRSPLLLGPMVLAWQADASRVSCRRAGACGRDRVCGRPHISIKTVDCDGRDPARRLAVGSCTAYEPGGDRDEQRRGDDHGQPHSYALPSIPRPICAYLSIAHHETTPRGVGVGTNVPLRQGKGACAAATAASANCTIRILTATRRGGGRRDGQRRFGRRVTPPSRATEGQPSRR